MDPTDNDSTARPYDHQPALPPDDPASSKGSTRPIARVRADMHTPPQGLRVSTDLPNSPLPSQPSMEPTLDQTAPYKAIPRHREVIEEPLVAQTAPYKPIRQRNVASKKGNRSLVLGILALLLLVAAALAAYWVWSNMLHKPSVPAARLLPPNTLAYLAIDPSPSGDQKAAFNKMRSIFESDPAFKDAWANTLSRATNFTHDARSRISGDCTGLLNLDDVSSYLGNNVTLALLPPTLSELQKLKNSPVGLNALLDVVSPNLVAIVDLDFNPLNKRGPIADLKKQADDLRTSQTTETYRATEIHKLLTCDTTLYFTILDGTSTAIAGGKIELLHTLIDYYRDGKDLSTESWYRALADQTPQDRVGTLFINLGQIYSTLQPVPSERATSEFAPTVEGAWLIGFSGKNDGVQIDLAAQAVLSGLDALTGAGLSPASIAATAGMEIIDPAREPDVSTLSAISRNSLAFLVGADLSSPLGALLYAQRRQDYGSTSFLENDLKDKTGLDLQKDIFPLLIGDYVLSVAPSDIQGASSFPPIVLQVKLRPEQRVKAVGILPKVLKILGDGDEPQQLNGGILYKRLGSIRLFARAAGDWLTLVVDNTAVSGRDRISDVASNGGKGFGSTSEWKYASRHLPGDSNVIGYADLEAVRATVERSMPPSQKVEYSKNTLPLLHPFKSLLIGSTTQSSLFSGMTRNHTVIFLGVGK